MPSNGGDTLFSSMYAAYDALSEAMKNSGKLSAMHDGGPNYIDRAKRAGIYDPTKVFPANPIQLFARILKLVARLYLLTKFLHNILSTYLRMSRAILDFLFQHIAKPNFQCRFKWKKTPLHFGTTGVLYIMQCDYYPETRRGLRKLLKVISHVNSQN